MEHPSNNIDDLLRARLENAALPPPAFVWPNVERALRRRKRRAVLWLLAAGLAGAGVVAVWSRHGTAPVLPAPASVAAAPDPAQQAPVAPVDAATTTPAAGTTRTESAAVQHLSAPGAAAAASTPVAHPTPSVRISSTNKGVAPVAGSVQPVLVAAPAAGQPSGMPASAPVVPGPAQANAAPVTAAGAVSGAADYLPGRLTALEEPRRQDPPMPLASFPEIKKRAPKKCYDFHSNRQAWLLDAYIGPSFIRKSLNTDDPEYRDYVADRQRTEQHELAFHGGVRASYLFAENFIVRTGLHYDQFTEKFEYIDPNFIKYTVEVTQKFINGQWVSTLDTVDFQYGSNYVKTYNRFGMLDIPLQAALELRSGITGVSLNLGGSVNVLFWKRGSMLGLDNKPVEFTPEEHQFDVFKPRLGLSLLGSIQWFIHAGPKTRIFAEPYYRHLLEPVMRAGYPVKQSYGIGGIRFGVTRIVDVK